MNTYLQNTFTIGKMKNFLIFFLFIFISFNAASQGFTLDATGVPFKFLNTKRITLSGPALGNVGSAALYTDIASIDGRVINGKITVVALSNASIDIFDNDTGGTDSNRFQPEYSTTTSNGGFITYKMEFFDKLTGVPVYISNFFFNGLDLDSAGGDNGATNTEVYRMPNSEFSSYTVNNPTSLVVSQVSSNSETQFRGNANNFPNITFENTSSFYVRYINARTSITFKIGANGPLNDRQTAVIIGVAGSFTKPDTDNNAPVVNDLRITKTVDIPTAPVNTIVTFTITATNFGPGAATNVKVTDKLPSGYTIGTVTPPAGTTYNSTTGIWEIGGLANNESILLNISATVKSSGIYKNEAGVTGNEAESNTANNTASATVALCTAPVITAQPATLQNVCKSTTASALSVSATGSGTLTYQWYRNATNSSSGGTAIGSATAATYTPPTTTVGTTYYYVIIKGTVLCGSTTSSVARVNVNPLTVITAQPGPTQTVCQNTTPTEVTMTATGSGVLTYKLYSNTTNSNSNGTLLGSGTTPTFTPPTETAGTFYYYVIVTSDCAPVTSNVFTITVNPPTVISTQPIATQSKVKGSTAATISVTASGAGLSYQWYKNTTNSNSGGTLITSATAPTFTPPTTAKGTIYYYAVVTGSCGSITSSTSAVIVTVTISAVADAYTATATQAVNGATLSGVVTSNDLLNGETATTATVSLIVNTPATPAYIGAPIPSLNTTNGRIIIPIGTPAGSYSINYKICEKPSTDDCSSANITITVAKPEIDAVSETLNTTSSGGTTTSVLANDTYNGGIATTANVTLTPAGILPAGITLNTDGTITIAAGTSPASYSVQYKICDKINPNNCDTATTTIIVGPSVDAVVDTFSATATQGINGATSVGNVLTNDKVNGVAATNNNASIAVNTAAVPVYDGAPVPTLNTSTGEVLIPLGTPAGIYTIKYKICVSLATETCDSDTASITVTKPAISAVADNFTLIGGGSNTKSVLVNDIYNDGAAGSETTALINLTQIGVWPAGITLNSDGTITVALGTPAAEYVLEYKICDKLNPENCSSAFVTIKNTACYKPAVLDPDAGNTLGTEVGISALERAGVPSTWPKVRESGWIVLEAKTKGFVINRMPFNTNGKPVNTNGVEVITSPIEGMMVYDTTADCLKVYTTQDDGSTFAWFCMGTQTCPE